MKHAKRIFASPAREMISVVVCWRENYKIRFDLIQIFIKFFPCIPTGPAQGRMIAITIMKPVSKES